MESTKVYLIVREYYDINNQFNRSFHGVVDEDHLESFIHRLEKEYPDSIVGAVACELNNLQEFSWR